MLQFLGDAVFIPSGAPHQVINKDFSFIIPQVLFENILGKKLTFVYQNSRRLCFPGKP